MQQRGNLVDADRTQVEYFLYKHLFPMFDAITERAGHLHHFYYWHSLNKAQLQARKESEHFNLHGYSSNTHFLLSADVPHQFKVHHQSVAFSVLQSSSQLAQPEVFTDLQRPGSLRCTACPSMAVFSNSMNA